MKTETFTPPRQVDSLWFGCEDAQSREYDWSENFERYTAYEAVDFDCQNKVECEACDGGEVDQHEEGVHPEPCEECDGTGEVTCSHDGPAVAHNGLVECPECGNGDDCESADGPMMNYVWPLPDHASLDSDDALKLAGVSLCLVHFDQSYNSYSEPDPSLPEWGLALTGGGMDLSWDIAEAYCLLGYLPPVNVCRLPRFAGSDYTDPRRVWVMDACKRSLQAVRDHAQAGMDYLDNLGEG